MSVLGDGPIPNVPTETTPPKLYFSQGGTAFNKPKPATPPKLYFTQGGTAYNKPKPGTAAATPPERPMFTDGPDMPIYKYVLPGIASVGGLAVILLVASLAMMGTSKRKDAGMMDVGANWNHSDVYKAGFVMFIFWCATVGLPMVIWSIRKA